MNWILLAYILFGCLVYAAGVWRLTITMKPRMAYTGRWRSIRFPYKQQQYISNLEIRWPINAFHGRIIMFDVRYMNLQSSSECQKDSVQLYNGVDYTSSSARMDTFCGTSLGSRFYNSTGSTTSIRFISNSDDTVGDGFKIKYRALELPETTTTTTTPTTTTTITTTAKTSETTTSKALTTTTKTEPTTRIVAPTTTMMTTTTTEKLTTTSLKDMTTSDIATTSADPTTKVVVTSAISTATILDEENEDDINEENSSESSLLTNTPSLLSIPFCFHHYTNQHILTATSEAQVFKSLGYPKSYPSNLREEWLIIKPKANDSLAITVVDADTEFSGNCGYDRVAIYDRSCPDSSAVRVFCGTATPSVTLKGDKFALVRFYADTTNHGRGIMVKYWLEGNKDPTADEEGLDEASLKSIIVGVIVAVGGFCVSLGVIRWVMRCQERRRQKAGDDRRRSRAGNESDNPPARVSRRHRQSGNGGNPTITVVAVSHGGRAQRNGRDGRHSLDDFTGVVVRPPSYSTLFESSQRRSELILQPPAYDAKSYEPPPYPGSPVPPPSIDDPPRINRLLPSVHGTRGANRRNQRTQNTTRIIVKPQDAEREEVRSPPPRYEE